MKKIFYLMLVLSLVLIVAGIGMLVYPKITDYIYLSYQNKLRQSVEGSRVNNGGIPLPEEAVCKIVIPKIKLDAYVLSGTTHEIINKGPGHYEETPLPGENGNSCIAGHRTMYGHPFRYLDQLDEGDQIIIYNTNGKFTYRVSVIKIVSPKDLSVINQSQDNRITLTTCNPVGSARQRLVVVGQMQT